jgi:hypothetical protein
MEEIARDKLGIPTLKSRRRDALDFHEVSIEQVADALQAAYAKAELRLGQYREILIALVDGAGGRIEIGPIVVTVEKRVPIIMRGGVKL